MMLTLDVNEHGCFYIRKNTKESKWQQICSKDDSALEIMIATFMNVTLRNREKKG